MDRFPLSRHTGRCAPIRSSLPAQISVSCDTGRTPGWPASALVNCVVPSEKSSAPAAASIISSALSLCGDRTVTEGHANLGANRSNSVFRIIEPQGLHYLAGGCGVYSFVDIGLADRLRSHPLAPREQSADRGVLRPVAADFSSFRRPHVCAGAQFVKAVCRAPPRRIGI